jgi:hypothetical protein
MSAKRTPLGMLLKYRSHTCSREQKIHSLFRKKAFVNCIAPVKIYGRYQPVIILKIQPKVTDYIPLSLLISFYDF